MQASEYAERLQFGKELTSPNGTQPSPMGEIRKVEREPAKVQAAT